MHAMFTYLLLHTKSVNRTPQVQMSLVSHQNNNTKTCLFTAAIKMTSMTRVSVGESLQAISSTACTPSFFELPLLSAHGALLLDLLRVQPLQDAVHVETMGALTPDQRAVISRHFTVRAAAIKRHPADPTVLIIGHPEPGCYPIPLPDLHLHPPCRTVFLSEVVHKFLCTTNVDIFQFQCWSHS